MTINLIPRYTIHDLGDLPPGAVFTTEYPLSEIRVFIRTDHEPKPGQISIVNLYTGHLQSLPGSTRVHYVDTATVTQEKV
jgi:hypothetical protein